MENREGYELTRLPCGCWSETPADQPPLSEATKAEYESAFGADFWDCGICNGRVDAARVAA